MQESPFQMAHRKKVRKVRLTFLASLGYTLGKELGKGGFGAVQEASKDGKSYAIKKVLLRPQHYAPALGITAESVIEADILKRINHPFLVKAYEILLDPDEKVIYFVLEKASLTFEKFLDSKTCQAGSDLLIYFFYQLICGLEYLHRHHLIHADIKPANILLFPDGTLKLTDFGILIRDLPEPRPLGRGTVTFMAPEILEKKSNYSFPIDIWALGIIMFYSVFKRWPILGQTGITVKLDNIKKTLKGTGLKGLLKAEEIKEAKGILGKNYDQVFDLVESCLQFDTVKRATAEKLLSSSLFSDYKCPEGKYEEAGETKMKEAPEEVINWLEKVKNSINNPVNITINQVSPDSVCGGNNLTIGFSLSAPLCDATYIFY